ncbi:MAG: hypothetical protein QM778_18350 [Myxococcales bacterium]
MATLLAGTSGCAELQADDLDGDERGSAIERDQSSDKQPVEGVEQAVYLPGPCIPTVFNPCPSGALLVGTKKPTGLAANDQLVFWSSAPDAAGAAVFKIPVTGGAASTVVWSHTSPFPAYVTSLAIDPVNVYWFNADFDPNDPHNSISFPYTLWHAPQAGGTAASLFQGQTDTPTMPLQGLAPSSTSQSVYAALTVSGIRRASYLSFLNIHTWLNSAIELNGIPWYPFDLTVDTQNVYFSDNVAGSLYQRPLSLAADDPNVIHLGDAIATPNSPLANYNGRLYYASGNSIKSVPSGGGGQPSTFATDSGPPTSFAVDGANLYWTCTKCGTVSKQAFGGGAATVLAFNQSSPKFVAVNSTDVFWGTSSSIRYTTK